MDVSTILTTFTETIPAFQFGVCFLDLPDLGLCGFKEASGMSVEYTTEQVRCGGENRFQYTLPGPTKYPNLVLKRGATAADSLLFNWVADILGVGSSGTLPLDKPITPMGITVYLLGAENVPLVTWTFYNAYPIKWAISGLDSMKNEVVIDTLELSYQYFTKA